MEDVRSCSTRILSFRRACEQNKMKEGESGWVLQGVISRASFRRTPSSGQKSFTVAPLHINNNYAKKRGIGKKLLLTIRAIMLGRALVTTTGLLGAKCVGCDIVQADHAPEAGVAQGIFHGILVKHHGRIQEEVEERLEEEVERRVKREHSSNQSKVRMHG